MNKLKIDQQYYVIPNIKIDEDKLIYEINDLMYSYTNYDKELNISFILNLPLESLSKNIVINSYYLKTQIKLFYSLYDDYLSKYLTLEEIKILKKTNISYLGSDINKFPKYIIELINSNNVSIDYKKILLSLINCKKIKIDKKIKIYNNLSNTYINIGNIFLKVRKNKENILVIDYATFSSFYQII